MYSDPQCQEFNMLKCADGNVEAPIFGVMDMKNDLVISHMFKKISST